MNVSGKRAREILDILWRMDAGKAISGAERERLLSLTELDCSWLGLKQLPNAIGELQSLQRLDVRINQLETLPDFIGNLHSLQTLNVSGNRLKALPETIGRLHSLQELDVSVNRLEALPGFISKLQNLQELDVSHNQLTSLPDFIGELQSLQTLYVYGNRLDTLPEAIGSLHSLQKLDVSVNRLKVLPDSLFRLPALERLTLSHLHLHRLPADIMNLGLAFWLDFAPFIEKGGIYLEDTTLATQPISLFQQPRELIQAYFDAEKVAVNEAKVIFLGDGGVGKSYTVARIRSDGAPGDYDTTMTPGISITNHSVTHGGKEFTLSFWDFGGQDRLMPMHLCFLTRRTCYVVMVSSRARSPDEQAYHWLKLIDSFAPGAPVLVVLNIWDNTPDQHPLNTRQIQRDFPNVVGFTSMSAKCSSQENFNRNLTQEITKMATRMVSIGMEFPKTWNNIRQELTTRADQGEYCITQEDYYKICADNSLEDEDIRKWLLEWFNDLGTCFSYHQDEEHKLLAEYKILKPDWLTNAIGLILSHGKARDGMISHSDIQNIITSNRDGTLPGAQYEAKHCQYILELMRKFRLSTQPEKEKAAEFIPALCPNEPEQAFQPGNVQSHIAYELEYTYLPDIVLHRLMVYCHASLKMKCCWRRGMAICSGSFSALVQLDGDRPLLKIDVYSQESKPLWPLLQILLGCLHGINDELNLKPQEFTWAEKDNVSERFPMTRILTIGRRTTTLQGEGVDFDIPAILDHIYSPGARERVEQKAKEHSSADAVNPAMMTYASFPDLLNQINQINDKLDRIDQRSAAADNQLWAIEQWLRHISGQGEPTTRKRITEAISFLSGILTLLG